MTFEDKVVVFLLAYTSISFFIIGYNVRDNIKENVCIEGVTHQKVDGILIKQDTLCWEDEE